MLCNIIFVLAIAFVVIIALCSGRGTFKGGISPFHTNIEADTLSNDNYRKVIYTDKYQQVVLMSLNPGEDIPKEIHDGDQFFHIEAGDGYSIVGDNTQPILLTDGSALVVPAGTPHYVKNNSPTKAFKLYSIYSPPQHKPSEINKRQPPD